MKKILFIIHQSELHMDALNIALEVAIKSNAKLKGLFICCNGARVIEGEKESSYDLFLRHCRNASIPSDIKEYQENDTEEILAETAFADIVVCGNPLQTSLFPIHFLVSSSHCPVLIVQKNQTDFTQAIFTYDGSLSSIDAIKQFTYLFSFLNFQRVFLVSVLPANIREMEYNHLVREWVMMHYQTAEVIILKGDLRNELSNFINAHQGSVVIMGAFGRSALSRFFRESLASTVLKNTMSPIFISHS